MKGKHTFLYLLIPAMGILAGLLRMLLFRFGTDDRGLLAAGHPLTLALWLLTAAGSLTILLALWSFRDCRARAPIPAALGTWIMALGIALAGNPAEPSPIPFLNLAWLVCRWLSVGTLAAAGFLRLRGKQTFFLLHGIPCLFFSLQMVLCYQIWSRNPQLLDYVFPLLACVAMALFAYYQTAADTDLQKPRALLAVGLFGCFLCCAAAWGNFLPLYTGGAVWLLTDLPTRGSALKNETL